MKAGLNGTERRALPRFQPRLWPWFLVSCALCGFFALPFALDIRFTAPTLPAEHLSLDFLGVVGERQKEAQQAGDEANQEARAAARAKSVAAVSPSFAPPSPPSPPVQRPQPHATAPQDADPSPVQDTVFVAPQEPEAADEEPAPPLVVEDATSMSEAKSAKSGQSAEFTARIAGADDERQAERIAAEEKEEDALRRYAALVIRRINRHLQYPRELKKNSIVGKPRVRFRIGLSGEIVGRVEIVQSSGHPTLDEAAITATLAAAPFPTPPQETEVAPLLAFRVE
jgi:protein TonB